MKTVVCTVTRTYEFDDEKVTAEFGHLREDYGQTEARFMRESFHELCGFDRDEDHVDGSYARLKDEEGETTFYDESGGEIWY